MRRMLSQKKADELIALYSFYCACVQKQKTQQVYATTHFVSKGLKWKPTKVRRVKKRLIDLGLIEDIRALDKEGRVSGWYIRVRFCMIHRHRKLEPPYPETQSVVLGTPNASVYKSKCLKIKRQSFEKGLLSFPDAVQRFVRIYNGSLPAWDRSFLPVDQITDKLMEVVETFSDWTDSELMEQLKEAFDNREWHSDRTLVSILWSCY